MFGLFKKKEPLVQITNQIWMTEAAKWSACIEMLKLQPNIQFVVWFRQTLEQLNAVLQQHNYTNKVIMYNQTHGNNKLNYLFAEHHLLLTKEMAVFEELQLNNVIVLSSLDEPLFEQFGSQNILPLLQKLGIQPHERIEHSMINNSIKRIQEKIAEKVLLDGAANSQAEWILKNVK